MFGEGCESGVVRAEHHNTPRRVPVRRVTGTAQEKQIPQRRGTREVCDKKERVFRTYLLSGLLLNLALDYLSSAGDLIRDLLGYRLLGLGRCLRSGSGLLGNTASSDLGARFARVGLALRALGRGSDNVDLAGNGDSVCAARLPGGGGCSDSHCVFVLGLFCEELGGKSQFWLL